MSNYNWDNEYVKSCYKHQTSWTIQDANYSRGTQRKNIPNQGQKKSQVQSWVLGLDTLSFKTDPNGTA